MRFLDRQQSIIIIAVVLMAVGFLLLGYFPMRKKLDVARSARLQRQAAAIKAEVQLRQLPQLAEEVEKLRIEVGSFDTKVPPGRQLGLFLQQMAIVMSKHNLKEQFVQPAGEVPLELQNINCIPISIQCKGRVRQIFEFFKSLEQLDRIVRIERVELKNDRDFAGYVSMNAKAAVYYRTGREI